MNKLLDYIRRLSPLTIVLVSLAVGVLFGLMLLGWCIFPVQWYDTDPEDLRLEHRKDYLLMTADSYALTDDVEQARQRLTSLAGTTWAAEDIAAMLDDLVEKRMAQGDLSGADRLSVLAGLQVLQPAVTPAVTPAPPATLALSLADRLKTPVGMGIALGTLLLFVVLVGVLWMRRQAKKGSFLPRRKSLRKSFKERREPLREVRADDLAAEKPEFGGAIGVQDFGIPREAPATVVADETSTGGEPGPALKASAAKTEVERETPAASVTRESLGQFVSEYVKGELDFDTSFGIESPGGEFLGECGMGITEFIGEKDEQRVSAFEIWLFDKDDTRTVSKVLVSEHAYRDPAMRAKLSAKGELVVGRTGESLELETASLRMVAQIIASGYGESGELPPGSFFSRLKVKLNTSML
ncbi:MAG: hypothetical protein ABIK79_16955 [Chloroflexota bacterium]